MNTLSAIDLKRRGLVAIEEKLALFISLRTIAQQQ